MYLGLSDSIKFVKDEIDKLKNNKKKLDAYISLLKIMEKIEKEIAPNCIIKDNIKFRTLCGF